MPNEIPQEFVIDQKLFEPNDALAMLNRRYAVVIDGGKGMVVRLTDSNIEFMSVEAFKLYWDRYSVTDRDAKLRPLGTWWLKHHRRRTYLKIELHPQDNRREIPADDGQMILNSWWGFGIKPKPGDWSLMRRHIDVMASGNDEHARYILNWLAYSVQHPERPAEAVIAFRGEEGVGKGVLGNTMRMIFGGAHGLAINSPKQLTGDFNAHLRNTIFLFADEAFWPGDQSAIGTLKHIITEDMLTIEPKGRDLIQVPNRLHIMIATNHEWVVPAGPDARRYVVFDVPNTHKQDFTYFGPLIKQLDEGGRAAMLYDLLHMNLGDWHPREVVKTKALADQKDRSLSKLESWYLAILEDGFLPLQKNKSSSNVAWNYCLKADLKANDVKYHSYRQVTKLLQSFGCTRFESEERGWRFLDLPEARVAWEKVHGAREWPEGRAEWSHEPF